MNSSSLGYFLLFFILLLTACAPVDQTPESVEGNSIVEDRAGATENHVDAIQSSPSAPSTPDDFLPKSDNQIDDLVPTALSTQESEETPNQAAPTNVRVQDDKVYSFPQLMAYDSIPPVYDPIFVTVGDSPLHDEELVMGVVINGEAKAYPVTVLRFREMVDDQLGGIPILVTW